MRPFGLEIEEVEDTCVSRHKKHEDCGLSVYGSYILGKVLMLTQLWHDY